MSLRPSEIDILLGNDSDSGPDDDSGSESDDNLLSYSGSDDYEPSTEESSDEDIDIRPTKKKRPSSQQEDCVSENVGIYGTTSELIASLEVQAEPVASTSTSCTNQPTSLDQPPPRTLKIIKGKNGYKWTEEPSQTTTRSSAINIVHRRQQPKGEGKNVSNPLEAFQLYFTDNLIDKLVIHTNDEILRKQANYNEIKFTVSETNSSELKALLGVLIFSAYRKDNHLNTVEMFDVKLSGNVYKATFSEKRFRFLIDCLRFDSKDTREERRANDRFAAIREVWSKIIAACLANYEPGPYLTIDEQLLAFRGRSPFKMYIPNKPAKYGLKLVMLCDSGSKYMLNAEPYLGKGSTVTNTPLGQYYVKTLAEPFKGSNRNITMDNWFSSIPLADSLRKDPYNLTIIGTIRQNKPEIPHQMVQCKGRPLGDTRYLFSGTTTLLSHKDKKTKVVCLISTMHHEKGTARDNNKPIIIDHYNQTKGGVDTFDQMCSTMSCSRKTKRWPLCIFYGLINTSAINSFIILNRNLTAQGKSEMTRTQFMKTLHNGLVTPWQKARLQVQSMPRSIKTIIRSVLGTEDEDPQRARRQQRKRTTCGTCPYQKRRMTNNYCVSCDTPFCLEHRGDMCKTCCENI